MNFEDWREIWRNGSANAAPDATAVLHIAHEVRGKARHFERMVAWRDAREILGALLVAAVFAVVAWLNLSAGRPSWTCWIAAALPLGVAVFLLVDRTRARRHSRPRGETVSVELERAIEQARHQFWLLTNVQWWYFLPLGASVATIALHVLLYSSESWAVRVAVASLMGAVTVGLYVALWRLNQRVAHGELRAWIDELEDRRQQLAAQ